MMPGGQTVAAATVAFGIVGLGAAAFTGDTPPAAATLAVISIDTSGSSRADDRCADVARIAATLVAARRPVDLVLLVSGTTKRGLQPLQLGHFTETRDRAVLERSHKDVTESLESRVNAACELTASTSESPIFDLVAGGIGYLPQARCTAPEVHCSVWIRTDGLEGADAVLKRALRRPLKTRPARLDNEHIDVHICGLGERRRRGPSIAHVKQVWLQEFSSPERVTLTDACIPFGKGRRQ